MRILASISILSALLLSGCSSMSEGFAPIPPQVQVVAGTPDKVYVAAQQAFKRLDFVLTRSAMGRVEAVSAIHTSETLGNSRQLIAKVAIHEAGPGQSEVELWVTAETASSSMGGTGRQPLRENAFFGLYFAMLQQVLQEQAVDKPAEKN